jgi:hypothetical protein
MDTTTLLIIIIVLPMWPCSESSPPDIPTEADRGL